MVYQYEKEHLHMVTLESTPLILRMLSLHKSIRIQLWELLSLNTIFIILLEGTNHHTLNIVLIVDISGYHKVLYLN